MLETLLSVADICARYQCKPTTARKYMRQMDHRENPLMVTERAVKAWDERNTLPPERVLRAILKERGKRNVG